MGRGKEVERRKDPRYEVKINVDSQSLGMFHANYVSNISKGGVFIETQEPLPVQAEVNMILRLPEISRTITIKGIVAWNYDRDKISGAMRTGMGIRFINLSPDELTLLIDYLSKISQNQEPLP